MSRNHPGAERADLAEAFAHCERITKSHYENFPVASLLVPRALRPHLSAVYAFARTADDFADEAEYLGRRIAELDAWGEQLEACAHGEASHPVFVALQETIRRFALPLDPFRDLLSAFRQDCTVRRYASWDELLDYCRRSANPVGRLVLLLFGYPDEEQAHHADAICTGLQLTNFWQDVAVDLLKDRIYLPAEDRLLWNVTEDDLRRGSLDEGVRELLAAMVARTRSHFASGRPLLQEVGGRLGLEMRFVWLGGHRILDRIERSGYDVFRNRPRLLGRERAALAARTFLGNWAIP